MPRPKSRAWEWSDEIAVLRARGLGWRRIARAISEKHNAFVDPSTCLRIWQSISKGAVAKPPIEAR